MCNQLTSEAPGLEKYFDEMTYTGRVRTGCPYHMAIISFVFKPVYSDEPVYLHGTKYMRIHRQMGLLIWMELEYISYCQINLFVWMELLACSFYMEFEHIGIQ